MDLQITAAKLTGDTERDVKSLANHVFQLEEQLRYQLRNLDVTNFNDLGLARYENGRLQIYSEQVEIQTEQLRVEFGKETDEIYAKLEATATGLSAKISDLDGEYTSLQATVSGIQTTVSGQSSSISSLQSQITQTSERISAVVSAVDDSSGNVTAASIVAAINSAGSSVKISADHIVLTGVVTTEDLAGSGTTTINGDNIVTGTIQGINFIAKGDIVESSASNSFVVENENGTLVGKIGYAWLDETDTRRSPKLYLMTEKYTEGGTTYRPALKLVGAGGVSIEAGSGSNPIYIASSGSYITLDAINIYIRDNAGTEWEFTSGALYKNGTAVL